MRDRLGFFAITMAVSVFLVLTAAVGKEQWMFERRTAEGVEPVDITSMVDNMCTALSTREVFLFTVGIRHPPECAAAAEILAAQLEVGLRALAERMPPSCKRATYIDVPLALDPLPADCRYVFHGLRKDGMGVLALLKSCTGAEMKTDLLKITYGILHETVHKLGVSRGFRERGSEWADEGAAEYLAIKAMQAVDPEFIRTRLQQRDPVAKFVVCDDEELWHVFGSRTNRPGKLSATAERASLQLYDLYLGAFLAAERAGYKPLETVEKKAGKRPMVLGVDIKVLIENRHATAGH
jgi:hypothetical protein